MLSRRKTLQNSHVDMERIGDSDIFNFLPYMVEKNTKLFFSFSKIL